MRHWKLYTRRQVLDEHAEAHLGVIMSFRPLKVTGYLGVRTFVLEYAPQVIL